MFGAHEKGGLLRAQAPLSQNCLLLQGNHKSTKPSTQDQTNKKEKDRIPPKES
jgi:hypothetical protein